jgi:hypothetical protein
MPDVSETRRTHRGEGKDCRRGKLDRRGCQRAKLSRVLKTNMPLTLYTPKQTFLT